MDVGVANIVSAEIKLVGRSPKIALFEDVYFQLLGEQHPHSDVELAAGKKQRLLHVLLDHEGTGPYGEIRGGFSDSEGFFED